MKEQASHNKLVVVLRIEFGAQTVFGTFEKRAPGACFSKVPKLLYHQNEGVPRHETLQLFLFFIFLQHMKTPALQNKQVVLLRMAFRARKVLGTLEKRAPGPGS